MPRGGGGGRGGGGFRGHGGGVRSFSGRGGPGFHRFGGGHHHRRPHPWRRPWGWNYGYAGYPWGYPAAYVYPVATSPQPDRLSQNASAFAALLDDAAEALLSRGSPDLAADAFGTIAKYVFLWGYNDACVGTRMAASPPTSDAAGQIARTLASEIRIAISDGIPDETLAAVCRAAALARVSLAKLRAAGFSGTGAIS